MYFLNIAIPAFKRPKMLEKLLESIDVSSPGDMCISIYDDAEADYLENRNIAEKYSDRVSVFYQKNTKNLGIDKNIAQCFEKSRGWYTIVIGEDDLFLPGGLGEIIRVLKENCPKFLFLKYTYFNGERDINWANQIPEFSETKDFLNDYVDKLGFIGSFVVQTNKFDMQIFKEDKTYFNHVGCLLVGLEKIDRINSTKDNVIRNRVGELDAFTWKNEALNVFTGFDKVLSLTESMKLKHIDVPQLRAITKKRFDPFIFRRLIKLKAESVLSNRDIYLLGSARGVGIHRFSVIIIPKSICVVIYFFHRIKIWY